MRGRRLRHRAVRRSDGTCVHCRNGITTSCVNFGFWGHTSANGQVLDGGQGQDVRVPFADGTLVKVPGDARRELIPAPADPHRRAGHRPPRRPVRPASARAPTVVVVGDGAVGLCAVLAAKRLGAARIIADVPSRRPAAPGPRRSAPPTSWPNAARTGSRRSQDLLGGIGADSVLECVGTKESMAQALGSVRPGGRLGSSACRPARRAADQVLFDEHVRVAGGMAPVAPTSTNCCPTCWPGPSNPAGSST